MNPSKLFSRDFTIMVVGQIVSLFGNAILRFALSLYVLDATGSAAVFGGILALSMIPTVLCSPLGGVLADRVPRQRIMAALDFLTAALIAGYTLLFGAHGNVAAVGALMMLLSLIQAFYQPSVQASIPSLVDEAQLMRANGVVVQVQALASLLGPILGGILYGYLGLGPMLLVSGVCFLASAVMELFLRIPFHRQASRGGALRQVTGDLAEAYRFLARDNPVLFRLLFILAGINLFLSALFTVGLPFIIKIHLGLPSQLYGFAEAALGLGSILGGLLSGVLGARLRFRRSHLFLVGTALLLLPMTLALALGLSAPAAYGVIVVCVLLGMGCATLFNVAAQTFLQQQTPPHLLGKVASFVSAIAICVFPLGQAMYGGLFQLLGQRVWVVVLFGLVTSLLMAAATGRAMRGLPSAPEERGAAPSPAD